MPQLLGQDAAHQALIGREVTAEADGGWQRCFSEVVAEQGLGEGMELYDDSRLVGQVEQPFRRDDLPSPSDACRPGAYYSSCPLSFFGPYLRRMNSLNSSMDLSASGGSFLS